MACADNHRDSIIPSVPYRLAPLLFFALVGAILAVTWPWVKSFSSAVLLHWDPPFHAWKLELVARSILSGHLLPLDGNTNMYYPHPNVLYYEALHWPQALFAAPFFLFQNANPVLIYHITLIAFWALSGVCLWMLLSSLGLTQRAAWLGAFIFVLMPYRTSYMVEFNMQLNFALPLFLFFVVRYFQRPGTAYACGIALAWFLQASSELYQAIFLLLLLPFFAVAFLPLYWRLLGSVRKFWISFACALAVGGILTTYFLWPYLTLLSVQGVSRPLSEIVTHILSPLSYFFPLGRFDFIQALNVRRDEMIVYPTLTLMLFSLAYLAFREARFWKAPDAPRSLCLIRAMRNLMLTAFFGITFWIYFRGASPALKALYGLLPVGAVLLCLAALFYPRTRNIPATLFRALFASAVFSYFMGLGPYITLRVTPIAPNHLYLFLYKHLDALEGFRVVSRFSIFVLGFIIVAAAFAWDAIERRWLKRKHLKWLWILPLILIAIEGVPRPFKLQPLRCPADSDVIRSLDTMPEPFVLAITPMGNRSIDSRHMLQLAQTKHLSVYAWGGAYPPYTVAVNKALKTPHIRVDDAAALLRQLWPECLLLEQKTVSRIPPYQCNFADRFSNHADIIREDAEFALLKFRPGPAATEHTRLIRPDYLRANPHMQFTAYTDENTATSIIVDMNGYPLARLHLTPGLQTFALSIPAQTHITMLPNRLRFRSENDAPFHLRDFKMMPHPATAPDIIRDTLPPPDCPPWSIHLHTLPPHATPFHIRYPKGFEILGYTIRTPRVPAGGTLIIDYYQKRPTHLQKLWGHTLATRLRPAEGRWIEDSTNLHHDMDTHDIQAQAHPAIYHFSQSIPIPVELAPGTYRPFVILRDKHQNIIKGKADNGRQKRIPLPAEIEIIPATQ